jgi:LysM repeat protein
VVQAGDTLVGIAVKFQIDMATLMKLNNLTSNDTLTVGQTLIIAP